MNEQNEEAKDEHANCETGEKTGGGRPGESASHPRYAADPKADRQDDQTDGQVPVVAHGYRSGMWAEIPVPLHRKIPRRWYGVT